MRYYLIAGEASGDLHGSSLIQALTSLDPQAQFRAWGGDQMQAAGASLCIHYRELAIMGLGQVLSNLGKIWQYQAKVKADILAFQPQALILIDYSGLNLRMARWAKSQGLTVIYYIAPQLWATRPGRLKKIKAYVDLLLVILPFEPEFYAKKGYTAHFVGHPLLDKISQHQPNPSFAEAHGLDPHRPLIALLPGSRRQEIQAVLPALLDLSKVFPLYQFAVAGAPSQSKDFYQTFLTDYPQVQWIDNQTYDLLAHSQAAIVVSGTATLETALWKVPQIVVYKTSPLLYWLVKKIIKIPYIALVNIILGREAVPERIQSACSTEQLAQDLPSLLEGQMRTAQLSAYAELTQKLGQPGASHRAAQQILQFIQKQLPPSPPSI